MVEEHKYIENARGMRYYFEDTDNFGIKAGYMNESLAFPVASELACFIWDISVQLRKKFIFDKLWMRYIFPCNVVHDALYFIHHKDLLKDNYIPEVLRYYFTEHCKIATGDCLGMEMTVGTRWKDKNPEFSKETEWDFTENRWKWKQ